jgi:hypothetical protein
MRPFEKRSNSADRERSEAVIYKVGGRSFRRVRCWSLLLASPASGHPGRREMPSGAGGPPPRLALRPPRAASAIAGAGALVLLKERSTPPGSVSIRSVTGQGR